MPRVIKRSGKIVVFDQNRIRRAVILAADAADDPGVDIDAVVIEAMDLLEMESDLEVEEIQDCVEKALMILDYHDVAKQYILYRAKQSNSRVNIDTSAISDYIQVAKYAKYRPNLERREIYVETVGRVWVMHMKRYPKLSDRINQIFKRVRSKQLLPSMRSMQFGGKAIEANNARMYNCVYTPINDWGKLSGIFWLLLSGCGVGYSVRWNHILHLTPLTDKGFREVVHHRIEDTIKGWADALRVLIQSYRLESPYIEFNYSNIRPKGSPLVVSGGKAPGHIPLRDMLNDIRNMLDNMVGRQPRAIEIHDILCRIASAVLAGGIRRSSLIALFDIDDTEMMYSKTVAAQLTLRSNANNSAVIYPDTSKSAFQRVFDLAINGYGEPGFFFAKHEDDGCNPCGEILGNTLLYIFCNLVEINCTAIKDRKHFLEVCIDAAWLATLQAGFGDMPFIGYKESGSLIGVSLTGIIDAWSLLTPEVLEAGKAAVCAANIEAAKAVGLQSAIRRTCIKPSGTASLLLGAVGSGIHPHHAPQYFRRIIARRDEPAAIYFAQKNPHMVEDMDAEHVCLIFPIATDSRTKDDVSSMEFLNMILRVQNHWCDHNVSATVEVGSDDALEVADFIWKHRLSVTIVPKTLDQIYANAPLERVRQGTESKFQGLIELYEPINWSEFREDGFDLRSKLEIGSCEGSKCEIHGH